MSAELYLFMSSFFRKTEIVSFKLSQTLPKQQALPDNITKRVCPQSFFFLKQHNLNKPKLFHEITVSK